MKIVIGTESFAPNISGVTVFAERMARFLAENGHEVYVFAPGRKFKTEYDKKYDLFKVFRLRSVPNPFRDGFRIAFLPGREIKWEIQKIKPDLIHLQDPTAICSALLKEGKRLGAPVIVTNHFNLRFIMAYIRNLKPLHPIIKKVLAFYISRFYNKCDLVTTPSPTARESVIGLGTKTEVLVISNGVDVERFKPVSDLKKARTAFNLPEDKPVIAYVGRIDKDKSIDVIIKAIPHVLKEIDAHFMLVGWGDEVQKIKNLASKIKVSEHLTFVGRIEHESPDLPLAYQSVSLFAMPSCIETQSIVTLEALASGLPLVAARATSMPEFTNDDKNGLLFTPGKPKEMAEKIVKILKDRDLRQKMSENARSYAIAHSIAKTYKEFEALYDKVCKQHKK